MRVTEVWKLLGQSYIYQKANNMPIDHGRTWLNVIIKLAFYVNFIRLSINSVYCPVRNKDGDRLGRK